MCVALTLACGHDNPGPTATQTVANPSPANQPATDVPPTPETELESLYAQLQSTEMELRVNAAQALARLPRDANGDSMRRYEALVAAYRNLGAEDVPERAQLIAAVRSLGLSASVRFCSPRSPGHHRPCGDARGSRLRGALGKRRRSGRTSRRLFTRSTVMRCSMLQVGAWLAVACDEDFACYVSRLDDVHAIVRRKAAAMLGRVGRDNASVILPLIRAARDPDVDVRLAALRSLDQLLPAATSANPRQAASSEAHLRSVSSPPDSDNMREVASAHFSALWINDVAALEPVTGFPYLEDGACRVVPSLAVFAQRPANNRPRIDVAFVEVLGDDFARRLEERASNLKHCPNNTEVAATVATWRESESLSRWVVIMFEHRGHQAEMFLRMTRAGGEWQATGFAD